MTARGRRSEHFGEARLLAGLAASELVDGLTGEALSALAGEVTAIRLAPGELLVAQGDVAEQLYVVLDGEVEVELDTPTTAQSVSVLGPGAMVGEIGVLAGDQRSATVRARTAVDLAALSAEGLRRLVADHPEQGERLAGRATDRLRRTQLIEHFTSMFGALDGEVVAVVERLMEWEHLAAGDLLFAQGDAGDTAYLVATGRLSVCRRDQATGVEAEIGQVARGDVIGELALLDDQPRSASAYAVRDTSLIRFSRAAYDELLDRFPRVGLEVAKIALRRSRAPIASAADRHRSIAVAAVSGGVDLSSFASALTGALGRGAHLVTSESLDADLGRPGAAQIADDDIGSLRLAYHLESLEEQHRHLVLQLDSADTPWSRRALRWADQVLFVADAGDDPAIGPFEAELWTLIGRQRHPRVSLALLHAPETTRPHGTPRWLEHRAVATHHHLRRGDDDHLGRLARHLSGAATSIVLGGGGARGLGHLGVLRTLEALGIPVDMVGGTSIGSIMGVAPGMGWTSDEIDRVVAQDLVKLNDYTLPVASILRGERMTATLRKHFGDIDITDLWVPYFCTVTNLSTSRAEYLDAGPLDHAIRASISIPGVLPPVPRDGHLLVDGGVIDNIPVGEMRRRNPTGSIIAVDVAPDDGEEACHDFGLSMTGFRALRARRRGAGPPALVATMVRSSLVASAGERDRVIRAGVADLYLELPVDCRNPLDFTVADRVVPAAAASALPALQAWSDARAQQRNETPMALHVRAATPRREVIDPARRRRRRGVLLLTLRDVQLRAARFAAVVVGIAVVLTLLFLMTGLTEQFHREPRDTVAGFGADGWLLRDGASGAFTSAATMPAESAALVEGADAAPVVIARHSIVEGSGATDVVVIGYAAGRLGQPEVVRGALPDAAGEIVVDGAADLSVGDTTVLGGTSFVVSGLTDRRTMFAGMPLVHLPIAEAQALVYRGQPLATAVLVAGTPSSVPAGFTLLSPDAVADDATRPLERSIASVNLIRLLLWLVAALIIGTMTYLSALERRRDVAVLKAVGASTVQLGASIALQGVVIALVAAAGAGVLQAIVAPVFPLDVSVPSRALLQVPLIAVVVSLLAGVVGLRKAVSTDPALAFAGPGS